MIRKFFSVLGDLLLTAGVIIILFLAWQLFYTNLDANDKADSISHTFTQSQTVSPKKVAPKYYDDPPVPEKVPYGTTIGMLVVPKWYGITNNNMPVIEGTGQDVLNQAAAGHYETTAQLGAIGNFAVAGHRRTYGNSFRRVDILEPGDEVIISTKDYWYVYKVESHEIVLPTQTEVLAPTPNDPTEPPTERYLTMTTCHSTSVGEWGNDHRWIVHAKFSYWMKRSEGRPESVLHDPEVN